MNNIPEQTLLEVYKDLGQPAVRVIGRTLGTAFQYGFNFLKPLELANGKAALNLKHNLKDYADKLDKVAEEKLIDVNPQIGTPILQRLVYVTNEEIGELFTSLLATASNEDQVNQAHPGFIQLLDNLSVDEARIIKFLKTEKEIPFITVKLYSDDDNFSLLHKNLNGLKRQINLGFPDNTDLYLDNLVRLGVLERITSYMSVNRKVYGTIIDKDLVPAERYYLRSPKVKKLKKENGVFALTEYGERFIESVHKV